MAGIVQKKTKPNFHCGPSGNGWGAKRERKYLLTKKVNSFENIFRKV